MSKFNLPKNFTVTAHTGCLGTPDNSMESIDKAFESGADIFEVDVRFSENGIPILTHDDPVGGEPTLEDAFRKLIQYKNMLCNIDIKCTDNMKEIVALAKKHGVLGRIFYTGIHEGFVDAAKGTPEIPYYLNSEIAEPENQSEEYFHALVEKVKSCGAIGINCNHQNATKELVDAFQSSGLTVSIWTCNEEEDMVRILRLAPDNITTKYPDTLNSIKSER